MKRYLFASLALLALLGGAAALALRGGGTGLAHRGGSATDRAATNSAAADRATGFERPVRLTADGAAIRVEAPGYAAPCWADVDGDGKADLVVGQFKKGQMRTYKGLGGAAFAAGDWIKAEGQVAEVPGVW